MEEKLYQDALQGCLENKRREEMEQARQLLMKITGSRDIDDEGNQDLSRPLDRPNMLDPGHMGPDGIWTKREDIRVTHEGTDVIKFEGQSLFGMYDGMGKLWHKNGSLKYDGMFKNGGPHGERVLLYDENAQLAFDGRMNCGIRDGFGKSYWPNGQVMFEGVYKNDGLLLEQEISDGENIFIISKIK